MKQQFCIFIIMLCFCTSSIAVTVNQDSLVHLAKVTTDEAMKAKTYRNLADVNLEKPLEAHFLKLLYKSAKELKDKKMALETLTNLAISHINQKNIDSVYYYMDLIKKDADMDTENKYLSILRMRLFDSKISQGRKEAEKAHDFEINFLKNADQSNIYIQIEKAYVSGQSFVECHKYKEASADFEKAYQLANTLSDPEDTKYRTAVGWLYANNLSNVENPKKSVELIENLLELYKNNYRKYYLEQRPYYNIQRNYLQCYASLLMHSDILPKEKLERYIDEIKKIGAYVTEPFDQYNYLLAMCNYYLFKEDYTNALAIIDKQIKILPTLSPKYLPFKHRLQSDIYEELGNHRLALDKYKIFVHLTDSFASKERQEQLNTLQVEYEVDKLKFEKENLESRNKHILLITLSIILLLTIATCIYLYYHLKKEKHMKMRLYTLNQKAEESERMKTGFINSMCHEIRTPLNAIVGFSDIIINEDCDNDSKAEFSELINSNTMILTSLIDDLLVVSNLDSSSDLLPCESINVNDICRKEFKKIQNKNQKSIIHNLELPEETILFSTNAKYLALVLEKLLSNASKFTQEGSITLKLLKSENGIKIQVTDTGCGVPLEKQEIIFERFTKLDSFAQGNGLGLFLSKLIISRLKGNIQIDSSYINGARFIISLPVL